MGFIKHRFPLVSVHTYTHTRVDIYTPIYIVLYMRKAINSNHTI